MTVTEAVKLSGLTPSADYTGVETTDDFLLAVQTEASQTDVKNWVVCADHVREHRRSHCHPARPQRSLCGPLPALTAPRFSAPCAAGLCRSGPSRRPARRASGSNAKTPPVSGK